MTTSLSSPRLAEDGLPVDTVGAWVPHGRFVVAGAAQGPLAGLTFAAKDLYDVAGHPTGAGNPRWLATHPPAEASSPVIDTLLRAGATLHGKVLTDELAYSINGDNVHYGTPRNAAAPGRVAGGSSSGSAAAVAARLVDFALGTDTGGSTRVPASYCGIWGLRTTHGLLPLTGMVPLHPSYDTATWLAHDGDTFACVGASLLPAQALRVSRVRVPTDAWGEGDPAFAAVLSRAADLLAGLTGATREAGDVAGGAGLEAWRQTYVTASAFEGWQVHGDWIARAEPDFAPPIADRWRAAAAVTPAAAAAARAEAARVRDTVRAWLGDTGVMLLPSAAGVAPLRDAAPGDVDAVRLRTLRITCIAGLAGLPQVSLPWFRPGPDSLPMGVSLVGPAGSDLALIALARDLRLALCAA